MDNIVPGYFKANFSKLHDVMHKLEKGRVSVICSSAGGRPVYMAEYGIVSSLGSTANYSSSMGAGDSKFFADKTESDYVPTLMIIGCVHGGEFEGTASMLNLISIIECGKDLKGDGFPHLKALADKLHLVLIPIANPDGRSHVPKESFVGESYETLRYYNQGTWLDGSLCEWPDCKMIHPIKGHVSYLGGYFNDDGVNLMHDDFFGNSSGEVSAILDVCRKYAPDICIQLHGGTNTVDAILTAPYSSGISKRKARSISEALKSKCDAEGLRYDIWDSFDCGENGDTPASFDLSSAIHHVCGCTSLVYETNQGLAYGDHICTREEIYRHHILLFEALMENL